LAGSRLAWSMARDRAFPYSAYFAKVNKKFGIPLRAMLAIVVIDLIIGEHLANFPYIIVVLIQVIL
jgi:choline transport protein